MNENAMSMKIEIRAISNYRAIILSKYYLSLVLSLTSLYLGFLKYAMSPLYIVIILNALPPILMFALKDYAQRYKNKLLTSITNEPRFRLNSLKRKYKYSRLSYISNSISYLVTIVFIGIWQFSNSNFVNIVPLLINVPVIILVTGLVVRVLVKIIYQLKLPYDLMHNRLYIGIKKAVPKVNYLRNRII